MPAWSFAISSSARGSGTVSGRAKRLILRTGRGAGVSRSSTCPRDINFEGAGDALFCGETLFAGYRFRSDVRSHQWIGERLGVEVLPLELVDPRFYHLDTCFCPLAPDLALYYPGAFDEYGRSVLRDRIPRLDRGRGRGGGLVQLQRGGRRQDGDLERRRAQAGRRRCASGASACDLLGFSEFIKSGGSAKCLTLRIDGEEAASWKRSDRVRQITPGPEETSCMNELYILRHGIAVEPGTPGIPDDERPLTPKGEKRMRQIARGLRKLDLKLDRIVTSPLPRARATAEIVADVLDARDRPGDLERPPGRLVGRDDRALAARADRGAADDRRPQPDAERPGIAAGPADRPNRGSAT